MCPSFAVLAFVYVAAEKKRVRLPSAVTRPANRLHQIIVLLTGRLFNQTISSRRKKKEKKKKQSVCATGRVAHVPDLEVEVFRGPFTHLLIRHLSVLLCVTVLPLNCITVQWKACRLYKTGKDYLGFRQTFICSS